MFLSSAVCAGCAHHNSICYVNRPQDSRRNVSTKRACNFFFSCILPRRTAEPCPWAQTMETEWNKIRRRRWFLSEQWEKVRSININLSLPREFRFRDFCLSRSSSSMYALEHQNRITLWCRPFNTMLGNEITFHGRAHGTVATHFSVIRWTALDWITALASFDQTQRATFELMIATIVFLPLLSTTQSLDFAQFFVIAQRCRTCGNWTSMRSDSVEKSSVRIETNGRANGNTPMNRNKNEKEFDLMQRSVKCS